MNKTNSSRLKLKSWMEAATLYMTGEPVEIRLQKPHVIGRAGDVCREKDGKLVKVVFNLSPDLSDESFYQAWLHETIHVYLGHHLKLDPVGKDDLPPFIRENIESGIPFVELSASERQAYESAPEELETYQIAEGLDAYARQQAEFTYGNDDIWSRIRVLARPLAKRSKG
jgi:hypothetical protein